MTRYRQVSASYYYAYFLTLQKGIHHVYKLAARVNANTCCTGFLYLLQVHVSVLIVLTGKTK